MYELTRTGMEVLHESAKALVTTDEILGVFLSRYSEFVALEPDAAKRTRARRS
jgi:cytochrome c-type biogenesis protein CcmH/NrfF